MEEHCPTCGSTYTFQYLGRLGAIHWVRCRYCGDDHGYGADADQVLTDQEEADAYG